MSEPKCKCGHGLFSHYMCGSPEKSACLTGCGCVAFTPSGADVAASSSRPTPESGM